MPKQLILMLKQIIKVNLDYHAVYEQGLEEGVDVMEVSEGEYKDVEDRDDGEESDGANSVGIGEENNM